MCRSQGKLWWSVLYLCGFWGWNLSPQAWWQLPFPPKPSFLPICKYFWILLIRPRRASGSCIFNVSLPSVSSSLNKERLCLPGASGRRCRLTSVTSAGFATCMLAFVLMEESMLPFTLKKRYRISPEETFVYQIWTFFLLAGSRCGWKWQRRRGEIWLGKLVPVSPQMTHLRFSKSLRFLIPERICETQPDFPIKSS